MAAGILMAGMLVAGDVLGAEPDEIVVHAERRERLLGRSPVTAHVATDLDLTVSGIRSTQDLTFRTPGLAFSTNTVLGQPYLRGVGSELITAGAENTVATLVDGVYLARPLSAIQDFYDVEQVEVLKGPQGTLFGRNATGGVIHIVTRDPEPGTSAEADLSFGSYDALRIRSALNLPLVEDRAILRVAGLRTQRDGYSQDLASGRRVDDEDLWALRAKLLLQPADSLSILISGDTAEDHGNRNLVFKLAPPFDESPAVALGAVVPSSARKVRFDAPLGADLGSHGGSVKLRWQGDAFEFIATTAFRRTDLDERFDLDATEVAFASNAPVERSNVWTEEIHFRSTGEGPIEWLGGVFLLDEEVSQEIDVQLPILGLRDQPSGDVRSTAIGVFGNAAWEPIDWLRLSAGLRYSRDWREIDYLGRLNGAVIDDFSEDVVQDSWTPRFVVEVGPRDRWTVYTSASRGYKAGGFNTTVAQPDSFKPETLWSFESGVRGKALDGRVGGHAAGFVYLYDDIQVSVQSPGSLLPFPIIENAAEATTYGVELGFEVEVIEGLRFEGAATFLEAEFDQLVALNANEPGDNPDLSGNRMPNAPQASLWLASEYRADLGRFGALVPRVEYHYKSRIYFDIFQDPLASQSAYELVNVLIRYDLPDERASIAFYGRNLTNDLYAHSIIRRDGTIGTVNRWGAPRTYGLELSARF